eukprot:CAMPEP_0174829510 /NCGR_PEP_ID=MMETSP1114-20130205/1963_1 /TAXON_ID=312471 /ORGANISM="Neobodo designis, Strain CCAP 1951/1" /LENGTH=287 /DNA_ID=CAMNT_0016063261 /DNA_START=35 /DNA_END=901 /DNA_ORIENTATION=+
MAQHAVGSRISLTSKSEIRYEGFLNFIDAKENTVGLKNVRMYGTEGRKGGNGEIPAGNQLYEFIVFRGADIKDLTVYEDQPPDPAVISATVGSGQAPSGGKKDPSNPWHQNRDHANPGRGRGGNQGGGRGGYGGQQGHQEGGRGRGRGFSDRSGGRGGGNHQQQQQQQQQQSRGPRLEHTGREFAPLEGQTKQEFKEAFDFSKAKGDLEAAAADKPAVKKAYDKTSSFFDNLSSDVTDRKDRARGQAFREQQKKVDTETFGGEFVGQHANTRYRRSGRGRGRYSNRN